MAIIRQKQQAMGALEIGEVSVTDYNPVTILATGIQSLVQGVATAVAGGQAKVAAEAKAKGGNPATSADGTTSITAADFIQSGTSCKPRNWIALGYVQNLQRQANRVAHKYGWGKVGVDGEVGPATLALVKKIQSKHSDVMGNAASCVWIAADADVIGDQIKDVADALGVPATVSAPPAPTPVAYTPAGKVPPPGPGGASAMNAFGGMTSGQKAIFVGLLGGIGYVVYKKSKKKGRR